MTDPLLDAPAPPRSRWRHAWRAGIALVLVALLYYPLGMLWYHDIDDDTSFVLPQGEMPAGGSQAAAMAAALIDREVNGKAWVANDPWFLPSSLLDNMPNYQMGMVGALGRFAFELTDQLGRSRGSSQADPDLQEAAGLLQYSGTKWVFDLSTSLWPTATSEEQYRRARVALRKYNERLAAGNAVFDRRADNLIAALDRFSLDLGSSSAVLDRHIHEHGGFFDRDADDLFYGIKGQSYAYCLIFRELKVDFAQLIRDRDVGRVYDQAVESMCAAARLDPVIVMNGAADGWVVPNHLTSLGFYILRSRTQLREIVQVLMR